MTTKLERRLKIKAGVRGKISGTTERPRLTVFRSNKQIYAQVIDDTVGKTLASASSLKLEDKATKKEIAAKVGELIAKNAQEAGVQAVVFLTVMVTCIMGELKNWQMLHVTAVLNFNGNGK